MLRPPRDLEPDAASVVGQSPAVAQRIHEEKASTTDLGRAAADESVPADARSRIGNLAAHAVPGGLDRDLDWAARPMLHRVRDELGDDHLDAPAVVVIYAGLQGGLTNQLACARGRIRAGRQLQAN